MLLQFTDVAFYDDWNKNVSCQVELHANGDIITHYKRIGIADAATVGVQNFDRTEGTTAVYNDTYLHERMAVRMRPLGASWLSLASHEGVIEPDGSMEIPVSFTNRELYLPEGSTPFHSSSHRPLRVGTYTSLVELTSTDLDDGVLTVPVILTVEGNPNNHVPVAQDVTTDAFEDSNLLIDFAALNAASDADGDALFYEVVSRPTNGTVSVSEAGITYRPSFNFSGVDSLLFVASDLESESEAMTLTIAVQPVNDRPVVNMIQPYHGLVVDLDRPTTVKLSVNDVDSEIDRVEVLADDASVGMATHVTNTLCWSRVSSRGSGPSGRRLHLLIPTSRWLSYARRPMKR